MIKYFKEHYLYSLMIFHNLAQFFNNCLDLFLSKKKDSMYEIVKTKDSNLF